MPPTMKVIQSLVNCASDLYKYALLPPSLETTRRKRELSLNPSKATKTIKKKQQSRVPRNRRMKTTETKGDWAVSNNANGLYFAAKVNEGELSDYEDNMGDEMNNNFKNNHHSPSPSMSTSKDTDIDKERILQLEAQLEDLKRSLASMKPQNNNNNNNMPPPPPSAFQNLPPPPPSIVLPKPIAVKSVPEDTMTPSFSTPKLSISSVPPPNFDQQTIISTPSPKKIINIPIPPPLPNDVKKTVVSKSMSFSEANLCRNVPSGLMRTQSITDLIANGIVSKNTLKRAPITCSPGGTPIKMNNNSSETFLAKALRKKFQNTSSPHKSDDQENNINNIHRSKLEELSQRTPRRSSSDSVVSDSEWDSPIHSPLRC